MQKKKVAHDFRYDPRVCVCVCVCVYIVVRLYDNIERVLKMPATRNFIIVIEATNTAELMPSF